MADDEEEGQNADERGTERRRKRDRTPTKEGQNADEEGENDNRIVVGIAMSWGMEYPFEVHQGSNVHHLLFGRYSNPYLSPRPLPAGPRRHQ